MTTSHRFPRPLLLFLGLLALIVITHPQKASAAQTCYDQNGQIRECTATEQYGSCLYSSADSFDQCKDDQPWYTEGACYVARLADDVACTSQFVEAAFLPVSNG